MDKQREHMQNSLKTTEKALVEANLKISLQFTDDVDKKEAAKFLVR
jgi:hypothetical protein